MGVSSSKKVRRKHENRDDASNSNDLCPSGASWYDNTCADSNQESLRCFFVDPCGGHALSSSSTQAAAPISGKPLKERFSITETNDCIAPESFYNTSCGLPGDFWYGCFSPNPCISATSAAAAKFSSGTPLKNTNQAFESACPSGYSYYNTTCGETVFFEGCFNEEPCDHRDLDDGVDNLAITSALGVPEETRNFFSIAATSSDFITKLSSTRTRVITLTTSTSSNSLRSSASFPMSPRPTTTATSVPAHLATSATAVSSAPAKSPLTSLSPHSDTAAVAGGIVGAIVGAVVALILILLVLKWRKRRKGETGQTTKHEDEIRMEGYELNGVENSIQYRDGSEIGPAYRDAEDNPLLHPGTSNAFKDGDAAYKLSDSHSAVPSGSKPAGSSPDPTGRQHELEVPAVSAFHSLVELSPKTERSLINIPRQNPSLSSVHSNIQGGFRQTADGSVMYPNMNLAEEDVGSHGAKKTGVGHVMSWMSYEGDGRGPEG